MREGRKGEGTNGGREGGMGGGREEEKNGGRKGARKGGKEGKGNILFFTGRDINHFEILRKKCIIYKLLQVNVFHNSLNDVKEGKYIYPGLPSLLFFNIQKFDITTT